MPKTVLLPNQKILQFPEDATSQEMNMAIGRQFPELFAGANETTEVISPKFVEEKQPRNPPLGMVFGQAWDQSNLMVGRAIQAYGELTGNQKDIEVGQKWIDANKKELEVWDKKFEEGGYKMLRPGDVKGLGINPFGGENKNERGAWDFIQQSTAATLPYLLQIIPAAVVGARTAPRWVPSIGKKLLTKELSKKTAGSMAAAFLPSEVFNVGVAQDEIKTRGGEDLVDPTTAFKYGTGMALLDSLALGPVILGSMMRYGVKPALKAGTASFGKNKTLAAAGTVFNAINKVIPKGKLGKAAFLGVSQAGSEGFTERLQEILAMEAGYDATGKRVSVEERANRLLESTWAGAAAGFGFGSTAGAVTGGGQVVGDVLKKAEAARDPRDVPLQQGELFGREDAPEGFGGGRQGPELFGEEQIEIEEQGPSAQIDLFDELEVEQEGPALETNSLDPTEEIIDSSIPFQEQINNSIENITERVLNLFNAGVNIDSQIISRDDVQEINKTTPEHTKTILDTLVNNDILTEIITEDGEVTDTYRLSDTRKEQLKQNPKGAEILFGKRTDINNKEFIKNIINGLAEVSKEVIDNFEYITWEGGYQGKQIRLETDVDTKPGLIQTDGTEGPGIDTQIVRVTVEDKNGNEVELTPIEYKGKKTDPVRRKAIKQVAEYYQEEIPSLLFKNEMLGDDFTLDTSLEEELDTIDAQLDFVQEENKNPIETKESRMDKGERVELVESLSQSIISGSILDKANDAELLKMFGDEDGVKKFRAAVKEEQDAQRTFGAVDPTGSINKSNNQRKVKDMEFFDPINSRSLNGHAARLNLYETYMNGTYQTAFKYPAFAKMYNLLRKYNIIQRETQAELTDFFRAYAEVAADNPQGKANLDRFIIAANILGEEGNFTVATDESSASVTFPEDYKHSAGGARFLSGQEAVDASLGDVNDSSNPDYITIGKPITLNSSETEAFMSLKRGFKEMADKNIEVTVRYKDDIDSNTYGRVVDRWIAGGKKENLSDLFKEEVEVYEESGDIDTATEMAELAEFIENLEDQAIENYFPNVREGDGIFRIVWKGEKDGKDFTEVVYRTDIIKPLYSIGSFEKYSRQWIFKNLPTKLFETYPEKALVEGGQYEYQFFNKVQTEIQDVNELGGRVGNDQIQSMLLESHNQLALRTGNKQGIEAFQAQLRKVIQNVNEQRKLTGLNKHYQKRKGIPGYVTPQNFKTYIPNSFSIYSSQVARYFARASTEKQMDSELELLRSREPSQSDGSGQAYSVKPFPLSHSLYTFGKKAKDFTLKPQSALSMFKSIAFYGFLGGNLSSIMINLMQGHVTAIALTGVYGINAVPEVIKNTVKAAWIAASLTALSSSGKRGLYIPSLKSTEAKVRRDAEQKLLDWKWLGINRDQYEAMAQLAQRGTIGKINTEALSGNSDIQMQYFLDKIGVGTGAATPLRATANSAVYITNKVGAIYAWGELTNRIAAGLSTYNLAKKYGVAKMNKFNSAEVMNSDLIDNEAGYIEAADMIVNMSQFSLDAYNRPLLARQMGGIPVQFLPFVKMMIDITGNAMMGRYGGDKQLGDVQTRWTKQEIADLKAADIDTARKGIKEGDVKEVSGTSVSGGTIKSLGGVAIPTVTSQQGAVMLIGMVMSQLFFGGAYGMPYADDLNEIVKLIAPKIGMGELDVKQEMVIWMSQNGVNELFIEGFEKGALNKLTGLSVNHRFSLNMVNNVIRNYDNPAVIIGGPAFSFGEGWATRMKRYLQKGDYIQAGLTLVPFALTQNIAKGLDAWENGVSTQADMLKMPAGDLQTSLAAGLGFTTTRVTGVSDQMARTNFIINKNKAPRARATKSLAHTYFNEKLFNYKGQPEKAAKAREERRELLEEIKAYDLKQRDSNGLRTYETMINWNGTLRSNARRQAKDWWIAQKPDIMRGEEADYNRIGIRSDKLRKSLERRNKLK
tara:strand:- start:44 stop:5857 length:5814 start_codon:yes stop_codon:yes gene_type:complete